MTDRVAQEIHWSGTFHVPSIRAGPDLCWNARLLRIEPERPLLSEVGPGILCHQPSAPENRQLHHKAAETETEFRSDANRCSQKSAKPELEPPGPSDEHRSTARGFGTRSPARDAVSASAMDAAGDDRRVRSIPLERVGKLLEPSTGTCTLPALASLAVLYVVASIRMDSKVGS